MPWRSQPNRGRTVSAEDAESPSVEDGPETSSGKGRKPPESRVLRELLDEHYRLIRSTDGRTFGVARTTPGRALEHGSKDSPLMRDCGLLFLALQDKWPSRNAVAEISDYVAACADRAPIEEVPVRSSWSPEQASILLDTLDAAGTVLRVDGRGARREPHSPVAFRRGQAAAPIPWDASEGSAADLDPLWDLVRVRPDDQPIVLALLVTALLTGSPQPIVLVAGPQDAGKTTTAAFLLSLIDPTTNRRGRSMPTDEREWKAAAAGSRVVLVDNVSAMSAATSDTLCRVATGGEATARALYTDDASHSTNLAVPVWMTAISTGLLRADLASRMVRIELEAVSRHVRLTESTLRANQEAIRPGVTRGLLWLTSRVLGRWCRVDRSQPAHRMGDFAIVVRLIDELLRTNGEARLRQDGVGLAEDVLDGSPVAQALLALLRPGAAPLPERMTPADLLERLNRARGEVLGLEASGDRSWPRSPRVLSEILARIEPALRKRHSIEIERSKSDGKRLLSIRQTATITELRGRADDYPA